MTIQSQDLPRLLDKLEAELRQQIITRHMLEPLMIGVHSGGVWVADIMHQRLKIKEPLAKLDISFYRDDFSQIGMHPKVKPSELPPSVEARNIILIDDVFYSGRTGRAALNEIFDFGRPQQIVFAVLIERNGRQIPVRPDCCGVNISLQQGQRIKLTGPGPLGIEVQTL